MPPQQSAPLRSCHTPAQDQELIANALNWGELFAQWPQERRHELLKSARLERYRKRALVMGSGPKWRHLLLVVSGSLQIGSLSEGGRKYVNALLGPGQVAPLVRLLDDKSSGYEYHAHEDAVIIHLPVDAVVAELDAEPVLWREVARLALHRQRISIAMLRGLTLGTVRRRVAASLINLAEFYGAPRASGLDLRVSLPQQDFAALLGLSRQTVNKQLRMLADLGVIEMSYKRLVLRDVPALSRIASED